MHKKCTLERTWLQFEDILWFILCKWERFIPCFFRPTNQHSIKTTKRQIMRGSRAGVGWGAASLFSLKRIIGLWPADVHHPLQNSRLTVTKAVQQQQEQLRHLHTPPNIHPHTAPSECHALNVKPVTLQIHTFVCLVPTQRSHRSLMCVIRALWSALFSPQEGH